MNDLNPAQEYYTYSIRVLPGGEKEKGIVDVQVFPPDGGRPRGAPRGELNLEQLLKTMKEVDPDKYEHLSGSHDAIPQIIETIKKVNPAQCTHNEGDAWGECLFKTLFDPELARHFRDTLIKHKNLRIELN